MSQQHQPDQQKPQNPGQRQQAQENMRDKNAPQQPGNPAGGNKGGQQDSGKGNQQR